MVTAILYDRRDAGKLLHRQVACFRLLALTPSAYALLKGVVNGALIEDECLTTYGHRRCTAAARGALNVFENVASEVRLGEGAKNVLRHQIWKLAAISERLALVLRATPGPWLIPSKNSGGWSLERDRVTALSNLIVHVLSAEPQPQSLPAPRMRGLLGLLRQFAVKRLPADRPCLLSNGKPKFPVAHPFNASGGTSVRLRPANGSMRWHKQLLKTCWRPAEYVEFPVWPEPTKMSDGRLREEVSRVLRAAYPGALRRVMPALEKYLVNHAMLTEALTHNQCQLLRRLPPSVAVFSETNAFLQSSLADAAGRVGIPRVSMNHNSFGRPRDVYGCHMQSELAHQRLGSSLSDEIISWSTTLLGAGFEQQNVRLFQPYGRKQAAPEGAPFRILFAGNYQSWQDFYPWIAETAFEFLTSIRTMIAVCGDVDGVAVKVRLRAKRELDAEVVRELVHSPANVVIGGTDIDFIEDLGQADLLVAYMSTTVEQALQVGVPVLLWGGRREFDFFPARRSAPRPGDRGSVYRADTPDDLRRLLPAIVAAHRRRPLNDSEIAATLQVERHDRGPSVGTVAGWLVALALDHGRHAAASTRGV